MQCSVKRLVGFTIAILIGIVPVARGEISHEQWSQLLLQIEQAVGSLKGTLTASGFDAYTPAYDRIWKKLGPQARLRQRPLIVVMLGMHNTGKSTFVNLMAGAEGAQQITAISAKGGATTIPVALLPASFPTRDIGALFGGFNIRKLGRASDATQAVGNDTPHLLWTKNALVPETIVIVDTPDIDSDHFENEAQSRATLNASDCVVVMLSDQYRNRDLIRTLKEVAVAQKPVIAVFNKAEVEMDGSLWPSRLKELIQVTGIEVVAAMAVQYDPYKAGEHRLLDTYHIGDDGRATPEQIQPLEALNRLQLHQLRIQAELGALELALGGEGGLDDFVAQVEQVNRVLSQFSHLFQDEEDSGEMAEWPKIPTHVVHRAILDTWNKHHRNTTTFAMRLAPNYLYKMMGAFGAPFKFRRKAALQRQEDTYRQSEFDAIKTHAFDLLIMKLEQLRDSGALSGQMLDIVTEKTQPLAVAGMQERMRKAHAGLKLVDSDLHRAIREELERVKVEEPWKYTLFRDADTVLAGLELVGTFTFSIFAGRLLAAPLLQSFTTSLVAGYVQTGISAVSLGPAGTSTALAGDKARQSLFARSMQNILQTYIRSRILWMVDWLAKNDLKPFYAELQKGIEATDIEQVVELRRLVGCARQLASSGGK